MSVTTTAHVNLRGTAREALEFYGAAVGGDVMIATYADLHQVDDEAQADQVAWGQVTAPSGFRLMAYDVQTAKPYDQGENAFYVALHGTDVDEVRGMWDGLAEGAIVLTPLGPAAFSPIYGMLTDRYGVTWIIDAAPAEQR